MCIWNIWFAYNGTLKNEICTECLGNFVVPRNSVILSSSAAPVSNLHKMNNQNKLNEKFIYSASLWLTLLDQYFS